MIGYGIRFASAFALIVLSLLLLGSVPVSYAQTPEACTDPTMCNPVSSIHAFWRCNIPGCTDTDWVGSVISWPSWSAYAENGRTGNQSRTVYSDQGVKLYPYMGSWAAGCQVTAVSGTALIIEWKRGTNVWRETWLEPGQNHTIALTSPEDGAMIEGPPSPGFSVSLANCNPQSVPTATPTPTPTNTPTNTPTPTPVTSGPLTIGEANILAADDSGNSNLLVAQQVVLLQNATIQSMSFYVTSVAGQLRLGIYDDAGGNPGTLRAQTAVFTPVVGWNTQNVITPVLLPAGTYWLVYLAESNNLYFRIESTGSARYYNYSFGTMPDTFSTSPSSGTFHYSFYATLIVDQPATSTPTNTPTPTPTDTPTSTPTNTPTPTSTDTPTSTPTHTPTSTPTDTPTSTLTDIPTLTPTDTPTSTPTYTPTSTPTDAPTITLTHTPALTPADTPTSTPTPPFVIVYLPIVLKK